MRSQLIFNGRFASGQSDAWVLIEGERIVSIGVGNAPQNPDTTLFDVNGALILPGAIDSHVHFREPGLTHKGTIASESREAVLGGITSYLEMPNTVPPTLSLDAIEDKKAIAKKSSAANYAFFIGASVSNIDELAKLHPGYVPGIKIFIGSSTGNMAVGSDDALRKIFELAQVPIVVHAEDDEIISHNSVKAINQYGSREAVPVEEHSAIRPAEACVEATKKALSLAREYGTRLHVAHLTTAEEMELCAKQPGVTTEVTPLYLLYDSSDYRLKGSRIKINPAVKSRADRLALLKGVEDGKIDIFATDHAPHLLKEKQGGALTAASGAPSARYALPLLLEIFSPETVAEKYSSIPAQIFGIKNRGKLLPGYYADIVVVEDCDAYRIEASDTPCGWSPYEGETLHRRVRDVWVNGTLTVSDGHLTGDTHSLPLEFRN